MNPKAGKTIRDVAQKAKVSEATVSRVLSYPSPWFGRPRAIESSKP